MTATEQTASARAKPGGPPSSSAFLTKESGVQSRIVIDDTQQSPKFGETPQKPQDCTEVANRQRENQEEGDAKDGNKLMTVPNVKLSLSRCNSLYPPDLVSVCQT